uniref:GLOBIN domain-containing protein n=1 Tax=Rhabditophanes sp. KR3021 TaxID=114890 RepID=A0AC35U8U3_9BILA
MNFFNSIKEMVGDKIPPTVMDSAMNMGTSKITEYFGGEGKNFDSEKLEAKSPGDLITKVAMTGVLINTFTRSKADLEKVANGEQQGALAKLGAVKDIFMNFKGDMEKNPGAFDLLKNNWKDVLEQIFKTYNLTALIPLLKKIGSNSAE